jgi:hypothetical protein
MGITISTGPWPGDPTSAARERWFRVPRSQAQDGGSRAGHCGYRRRSKRLYFVRHMTFDLPIKRVVAVVEAHVLTHAASPDAALTSYVYATEPCGGRAVDRPHITSAQSRTTQIVTGSRTLPSRLSDERRRSSARRFARAHRAPNRCSSGGVAFMARPTVEPIGET